jgi:hypothetical protein
VSDKEIAMFQASGSPRALSRLAGLSLTLIVSAAAATAATAAEEGPPPDLKVCACGHASAQRGINMESSNVGGVAPAHGFQRLFDKRNAVQR